MAVQRACVNPVFYAGLGGRVLQDQRTSVLGCSPENDEKHVK